MDKNDSRTKEIIELYQRRQREKQAEGVAKDWNAGMATGDIANKYGFSTKGAVHNFIRKLRVSGYEIERRRKNTK